MDEDTALAAPIRIIRDRELDDSALEELIDGDVLERNKHLTTFMDVINSVEGGTFISLDGGWGSGKTVFIKQLDHLNQSAAIKNTDTLPEETLELFRQNYVTYYYNAWVNDDQEQLQSLLFNLLKELPKEENERSGKFKKGSDIAKNLVKVLGIEAINSLINNNTAIFSGGVVKTKVDIRKLANESKDLNISVERLIEETITLSERKKAVSRVIGDILPDEKKLLFIIDELDRCAPSFAVQLLEVVKHYCLNDRVVFLLVTNNSQLAHTVKKFYGQDFDGAGYLDRFYDVRFRLPDPDAEAYLKYRLQNLWIDDRKNFFTIVSTSIVQRFFMPSLREINRYCTMLGFLQNYLIHAREESRRIDPLLLSSAQQQYCPPESVNIFRQQNQPYAYLCFRMVIYLFGPLALALAIKDTEKYDAFVTGKGAGVLKAFLGEKEKTTPGLYLSSFKDLKYCLDKLNQGCPPEIEKITDDKEAVEGIIAIYEKIFSMAKYEYSSRHGDATPDNEHFLYKSYKEFEKITNLLQFTALN